MRAVLIQEQKHRRDRLEDIISQLTDIEIVMQSDNVADVLEQCAIHVPEFIIFDVLSNDEDIPGYVARIKQDFFNIKVFVLTRAKDDDLAFKAKEAGADIVAPRTTSLDEWRQLIQYAQKHYRVYQSSYWEPNKPR